MATYHETIKKEPYTALTGNRPRCGLSSNLPEMFFLQIGCSDIREEVLEQLIEDSSASDAVNDLEPSNNAFEDNDQKI